MTVEPYPAVTNVLPFFNLAAAETAAMAWLDMEAVKSGHAQVKVVSIVSSPTFWIVGSGQSVSVGDTVALDFGPDHYGEIVGVAAHGAPMVKIIEGRDIGKVLAVWPHQIVSKRLARPTDR